MANFPFSFGGDEDELFDDYDEFVADHLPEPGPFLDGQDVLAGEAHVAFHEATRDVFEARGVYDMTFDYNLARLNLDPRHPRAGYRYAEVPDEENVIRAEFTPTTPFCPQTHTLTKASLRAWNSELDRHSYDLVTVRTTPMHHQSEQINAMLADLEERLRETGETGIATSERPAEASYPGDRTEATTVDSESDPSPF